MIELAITGAGGRMGQELIDAAADRDDVSVAVAVNRSALEPIGGTPVREAAELPALLAEHDPDVLVDFTAPESSVEYVETAADAGVPAVVGTTGFDSSQTQRLRGASDVVPVLKAANFSRGIAALRRAVREAVGALPEYDVEVTETHHNEKRDAPSGTAKSILEDVEQAREAEEAPSGERVHGREGLQPREPGEIGVHARRAGDITGEHEVLLAGNHEVLSLTHRAESRGVFAEGALDAAVWLADREPGWYEFADAL